MSKGYIMRTKLTGTRDGEDWPAVGEPVPEGVTGVELDGLVAAGFAVKVSKHGKVPEPETAVAPEPEKRRR